MHSQSEYFNPVQYNTNEQNSEEWRQGIYQSIKNLLILLSEKIQNSTPAPFFVCVPTFPSTGVLRKAHFAQ